jgi:hypothetical protein
MGLLSVSLILLSLTCLAALVGLALAAVFLWPSRTQEDEAGNRIEEADKLDQKPSDQE